MEKLYRIVNTESNFENGEVVTIIGTDVLGMEGTFLVKTTDESSNVGSLFGRGTQVVEAHELEEIQ